MDGLFNPDQLSLSGLRLNLLIGIVLSIAMALYYARLREAFSNRPKFARLLPTLRLITVFIISVIKGSLAGGRKAGLSPARSHGTVGA